MALPGFGPNAVQAAAAAMYLKKTAELFVDADAIPWVPSPRWCAWFIRNHLWLSRRRDTGHRKSPATIAAQDALHVMNKCARRFMFHMKIMGKKPNMKGAALVGGSAVPHPLSLLSCWVRYGRTRPLNFTR